jgi:intracellular septation protein A
MRIRDLLPAGRQALQRFSLVGGLPLLAFYVAYRLIHPPAGVGAGMLVSGLVLLLQFRRQRRVDPIGAVAFGLVLIQGTLALLLRSPALYLAAPAAENVLWGVLLLGSAASGRPLVTLVARELELLTPALSEPGVLAALRQVTVVWGIAAFFKAALRLALLASLPLEAFLLAITLSGWALNSGLVALSVWLPLRATRRAPAPLPVRPEPGARAA